jgi:hypothetical protein
MSQVNVIVIHVRAKQAAEYEKLFVEGQLPLNASPLSNTSSDGPLVFGGDLIHSVG